MTVFWHFSLILLAPYYNCLFWWCRSDDVHELNVKYNRVPCLSCVGSEFWGASVCKVVLNWNFGGTCVCVDAKCNPNASLVILPQMNFGIAHWSNQWIKFSAVIGQVGHTKITTKSRNPNTNFSLHWMKAAGWTQANAHQSFYFLWLGGLLFGSVVIAEVLSFPYFLVNSLSALSCVDFSELSDCQIIKWYCHSTQQKVIFQYKEALKSMSLFLCHDEMQCIIVSLNNRIHLDGGQLQNPGLESISRQSRQQLFH